MVRFAEVKNIAVTGTLIRYTPKPKGPPDSVEMSVDGYETNIILLLSKLRWSWTGWALLNDIWRTSKTMLIIPWNELPYIDNKGAYQGFNATAGSVVVPKLSDDGKAPVNMDEVRDGNYSKKQDTLVRFNPDMWNADALAEVKFIAQPADFKQAPGVQKDEILLHEMVHGLRQMRGTTDFHKPADAPHMDTVEEFMAIVVSNMYRSEQKRPGLRKDHWGFDPLPAAQEDPQVFLNQPGSGGDSNLARMKQFKQQNPDFFADLKKCPAPFNPFKLL
jgi:hypothetical protein